MNENKLYPILNKIINAIDSENFSGENDDQRVHIGLIKNCMLKVVKDVERRDSFFNNYKEVEISTPLKYRRFHYEDLRYQLLISIIIWMHRSYENCTNISYLIHQNIEIKNIEIKNIEIKRVFVSDVLLKDKDCTFYNRTNNNYRTQIEILNEKFGKELHFLNFIRNRIAHQGGDSLDLEGKSKLFKKNNEDRICLSRKFETFYYQSTFLDELLSHSEKNGFISSFENNIIPKVDEFFSSLIHHIWSKLIEKINSRI